MHSAVEKSLHDLVMLDSSRFFEPVFFSWCPLANHNLCRCHGEIFKNSCRSTGMDIFSGSLPYPQDSYSYINYVMCMLKLFPASSFLQHISSSDVVHVEGRCVRQVSGQVEPKTKKTPEERIPSVSFKCKQTMANHVTWETIETTKTILINIKIQKQHFDTLHQHHDSSWLHIYIYVFNYRVHNSDNAVVLNINVYQNGRK